MTKYPEVAMTAEEFCAWMEEHDFTVTALSTALHCDRSTVSNWRSGRYPITYTTKLALTQLVQPKSRGSGRKAVTAS